jgi:hypothetical protein
LLEASATIGSSGIPNDSVASTIALLTPSTPQAEVETNEQLTSTKIGSSIPSPTEGDSATPPQADTSPVGATEVATQPGERFLQWLRDGIQTRRLVINEAKALIHTVSGTAFLVTPGLFQRYALEHPHVAPIAQKDALDGWQWAQKSFERMRLHKRQDNGLNIWTCTVMGPRKTRQLYGYLLADGHTAFSELPPDNPYLTLQH